MFWLVLLLPIVAVAWYWYPGKPLPEGIIIDKLVVYKSKRKMEAYANGSLVKTYDIALGKDPVGHKQCEGDNKTPEGSYIINARNPNSAYHKNLGVSYPNETDKANAVKLGKPAGGDIKIHGLKNGRGYIGKCHCLKDWTAGCIAVTNDEVDELYAAVKQNAEIEIFP
ncbi:L,D-transpeptidase family protein [Flavobacterium hauense]